MVNRFCPICGKRHPEIANCGKYGVYICSAHCDTCQFRLGRKLIGGGFCGYSAPTRATGIPVFLAPAEDIKAELLRMKDWSNDQIAVRYAETIGVCRETENTFVKIKCRAVLAACQKMLYDRADSVIAEEQIPQMPSEDIREYRIELCRLIATNDLNDNLKRAVNRALDICSAVLNRRSGE